MSKKAIGIFKRQQEEIERLKCMVAQNEGVLPQYEALIKAEAIREFEDKFLDVCKSFSIEKKDTSYFIWADDFAKIIKEMTEDKS